MEKLLFLLIGNILIQIVTIYVMFYLLQYDYSSANATPDFEGRGGEDLAIEIANILTAAYKSAKAFDLTKLCIYKGRKCWKLNVDILVSV